MSRHPVSNPGHSAPLSAHQRAPLAACGRRAGPHRLRRLVRAPVAVAASAALLSACLGGGSGGDGLIGISGVVADGPLQGATVCYDLNDNAVCDAGDPAIAGTTGADGRYVLRVAADVAGQHAVVAMVPATAVDADTGAAIGAALVLRSPPTGTGGDQSVAVTALTTAVAEVAAQRGLSTADAAAAVQAALGLAASPLADFTAAGGDAGAAQVARALTAILSSTAQLADAAGVSATERGALLGQLLNGRLEAVASAAQDAAAGTPAERAAEAAAAVLAALNLSASTITTHAALAAAPAAATEADGPFVSVRRFAYSDAANWSNTLFVGDSRERDAEGTFQAHEIRQTQSNGAATTFNRNQAYWSGQAWVACEREWQVITGVYTDAQGVQHSAYCGGSHNRALSRVDTDITGLTLREVVARMRAFPLADARGSHTNAAGLPVHWGPDPALLPAEAVFPEGSVLSVRTTMSNLGGVDRLELTNKSRVRWPDGIWRQAVTLEQYGAMQGDLVDATAVPSGANTVYVQDLPLDDQPDASLESFQRWLAAFDFSTLRIRFYGCEVRKADQVAQNCLTLGNGTLAIEPKGDARLLRVASGYPAALKQANGSQRFWAERVGTVFRGATDLPTTRSDQRLNATAWEALRTTLGLPAHAQPVAPAESTDLYLLRNFSFTDAGNFSLRAWEGSTAAVDADGYATLNEVRRTVSGGALQAFARNRLYLVEGQWQACADDGIGVLKAQVAAPDQSVYCGGFVEQRTGLARVTLDGRRLSDVVNDIRSWGSKDGGFDYRGWGPDPAVHAQLAGGVFPAGSWMEYRQGLVLESPVAMAIGANDQVRVPPAPNTNVPFASWPYATDLDAFIAANPGDLKGASVNGSIAFWVWGYDLAAPASADTTTRVEIRVAFDADGQKARFYRNHRLAATGATTRYQTLLDTTYTIETLGGLRVLRFAAMPPGFETEFGFERRFAERNGAVWYAFKDRVGSEPTQHIRLNRAASQALTTALGIQ